MIDSTARHFYQRLLIDPLLKLLFWEKVHPHFLTLLATLFGICASILIATLHSYLALIALIMSGFCDTLDGSLARKKNLSSEKGAVLDIVSDRLVEFCIILGLFLVDPHTRGLYAILMLGSVLLCITSFLVVGIFIQNSSEKSFHYSPGLIERSEAFLFFSAMIFLPEMFPLLSLLFSALVFMTALVRIWQFTKG